MDTSARPRTRNPARRGPLSTPQLRSSTHVPSSCRRWISCGIDGIVLCSRGTASCSLRIALLVYTINSAALHHVSGDEMMERCTACSPVPNGKSAALIETSHLLGLRAVWNEAHWSSKAGGAALSLFGDPASPHDVVSRRSVWWCNAALCCSAIATTDWSCSGGSQSQLLSTSFWRCLHFPVYWGLWPALGLAAQHVIFIRICAFWRLKTRKIFWPRRGVRLKAGAAKFPDTTWFSDPYSDFESRSHLID